MHKLNIIFLGGFSYPHGMAGTERIQHAIDGLKQFDDINIRITVLRQSSVDNIPSGIYKDIQYETIMPDLLRMKLVLLAPIYFAKAKTALRKVFNPEAKNILFVYGPPAFDNIPIVRFARKLGFKIVFDIVEDDDAAVGISKSCYHRIQNYYIRRMTKQIVNLADGLIVISSNLERKFSELITEKIPLHLRPISVNFQCFATDPRPFGDVVTLFYAGSFGTKDGLSVLLEAFDLVAERRANVRLVLTGKGSDEIMRSTISRIKASPFRDRIEYKGYLNDTSYYAALNAADIPCMTRIDTAYAQAGFPFKLGAFLATGKPVIASRVSDIENSLHDHVDAMLVKPGDANAIAQAVDYLMNHQNEAAEIGARGRETARRLFDYQVHTQALLAFLHSL